MVHSHSDGEQLRQINTCLKSSIRNTGWWLRMTNHAWYGSTTMVPYIAHWHMHEPSWLIVNGSNDASWSPACNNISCSYSEGLLWLMVVMNNMMYNDDYKQVTRFTRFFKMMVTMVAAQLQGCWLIMVKPWLETVLMDWNSLWWSIMADDPEWLISDKHAQSLSIATIMVYPVDYMDQGNWCDSITGNSGHVGLHGTAQPFR